MRPLSAAATLLLACSALLSACTVPDTPPPARLAVWRDDGGLRAGLVPTDDAGVPGPDAGQDLLVRSSPSRNRDVGICSPDHFCWENPLPQGANLYGVWAAKADEVWAVGAAGTLLKWDGKAWTRWSTKTAVPLTSVWGADAEHGWALGPGALYRYDGKGWLRQEPLTGATLLLWGSAADDVWAAGTVLHHWDGGEWKQAAVDGAWSVVALAGLGPKDVWAVARSEEEKTKGQGILLRWDGKAWTKSALPFAVAQASLAVASRTEAYLATDQGVLARFDGKAWKKVADVGAGDRPVLVAQADGVTVAGPGRRIGRFANAKWSKGERESPALRGVWPAEPAPEWGVGDRGLVTRWTEEGWAPGAARVEGDLRAVHGTTPENLWAVGVGGLVVRRDEKGAWQQVPLSSKSRLDGVWAHGTDDVWVVGESELAHWDGKALTSKWEQAMGPLRAVVALSERNVYVAGDNGVRHFNGAAWLNEDVPAAYPLDALTVAPDGSVWALGKGGMVRFDGKAWTEVGASDQNAPTVLFGGGFGPYVAGVKGVWRHDGKAAWKSVISGVEIVAGWAGASDDVWALGRGEEVRQWNGVGWRKMGAGAPGLAAVWSRSGEAFVVGAGGAILHFRP